MPTMPTLLTIDMLNRWERVPLREAVPLRFTILCPPDLGHGVIIPLIGHHQEDLAEIASDGLPQEIHLRPGEAFTVTLEARFNKTGFADMGDFFVQVRPEDDVRGELHSLPQHRFEVVPSLAQELQVSLARICTYGIAAKVEIAIRHVGTTEWREVGIDVLSPDNVQAGITRHRRPELRPGEEFKFELVLTSEECSFTLSATGQGARVERRLDLPIPATSEQADAPPVFRFLEPRKLTTDQIRIVPEKASDLVLSQNGIYPLYGGKKRYVLTVHPSNPQAQKVKVYPAPGEVEVEYRDHVGGGWSFLMTVVDNPVVTQSVRLDYDVQVPGETLRGELYFSIRPSTGKLWAVAVTAGAAVTVRGAVAVGSNVFTQDNLIEMVLTDGIELFQRSWTDSIQLLFIFVIRLGLSIVDRLLWRPFQEG